MLEAGEGPRIDPATDVAATFSEWAIAHRAFGGDFNEDARMVGVSAVIAAHRRGLPLEEVFEIGRQAFYAALR